MLPLSVWGKIKRYLCALIPVISMGGGGCPRSIYSFPHLFPGCGAHDTAHVATEVTDEPTPWSGITRGGFLPGETIFIAS